MRKVLENIREIRESKRYSQEKMADLLSTNQSVYARFESGRNRTDLEMLELVAKALDYSVIDLLTYPKKYVDIDSIPYRENNLKEEEDTKAILQIELKKDKRDQVLKLVFGDNNLEILNK